MNSEFIQNHISKTYFNLRSGLSLVALLLPIVLLAGALISSSFGLQPSISDFYHTPLRNFFVGVLISVGSFLYLYKGYKNKENVALNIAGVLALGVAFIPTSVPESIQAAAPPWLPPDPFVWPLVHGIVAVTFFLAIAFVCIFCGDETVELIEEESLRTRYTWIYRILGILMVLLPAGAAALLWFSPARSYTIFAIETVAVWVFAAYWWTKSRELSQHTSRNECDIVLGHQNA